MLGRFSLFITMLNRLAEKNVSEMIFWGSNETFYLHSVYFYPFLSTLYSLSNAAGYPKKCKMSNK